MEVSLSPTEEKTRVAVTSVIAAVFLTAIKIVVGVLTGSLGILSEPPIPPSTSWQPWSRSLR